MTSGWTGSRSMRGLPIVWLSAVLAGAPFFPSGVHAGSIPNASGPECVRGYGWCPGETPPAASGGSKGTGSPNQGVQGIFLQGILGTVLSPSAPKGGNKAQPPPGPSPADLKFKQLLQAEDAAKDAAFSANQQKLLQNLKGANANGGPNSIDLKLPPGPLTGSESGASDAGVDLEALRAGAGRVFDGNADDSLWMRVHDAGFSPGAPGNPPMSSATDKTHQYSSTDKKPLDCPFGGAGGTCSVQASTQSVVSLFPVSVRPVVTPPAPPAAVAGGGTPRLVVQGADVGETGLVASVRRTIVDWKSKTQGPELPADLLTSAAVSIGELAMPNVSQQIASEGRDAYKNVVEAYLAKVVEVMTDAAAGRWNDALDKSDAARLKNEGVKTFIEGRTWGKLLWPALEGKPMAVLAAGRDIGMDHAWGEAKEFYGDIPKEKAADAGQKVWDWLLRPKGLPR
jgi:hypothetical protein